MQAVERVIANPSFLTDAVFSEARTLEAKELEVVQLSCAQKRFDELRGRVPILDRLAQQTDTETIRSLDDVARLLLPHTVFKSYPLQWIDEADFTRLTRWLSSLTSADLSQVDCRGLETIDDWIQRLDETSELRLLHSFGTGGKLSFIPRTRAEWVEGAKLISKCMRDWNGPQSAPDLLVARMPMVNPSYRFGAGAIQRGSASAVEHFAGGDQNALFLYPQSRFSADLAAIAGRLQAADLRGEPHSVVLSERLRAQRDALLLRERDRPRALKAFFDEVVQRFRGEDIYLLAVWPVLHDWTVAGLGAGLRDLFGPGSILHTGGGMKGRELPPGWRDDIRKFLGFDRQFEFYAMSELVAGCPRCQSGNYHVPPVTVPFLLDPESGSVYPREGRRRGRFAAFDLLAASSWGGFISGDEVTMGGWDDCCPCGRPGVYVEPDIRRYSAAEGGMDKISCAAANDAYERAVEFLIDSAGR